MLSIRRAPISRCRTRGSNGDSQASISDLSSEEVWLKVLEMLAMFIELLLLLKACDIFHFLLLWKLL